MKRSSLYIFVAVVLSISTYLLISVETGYTASQNTSSSSTTMKPADKAAVKSVAPLVTFIEIGAAKCIPCKAMQPIMKAVEEEYKGQVKVVFHDVWTAKGRTDAEKYNIRIIPTQVFLDKNGKEYFRHEGYFPKTEVVKVIKMQGVK
jgi:thioredoxin 1